jgi:ABC-type sugar transport system, periplasmic component
MANRLGFMLTVILFLSACLPAIIQAADQPVELKMYLLGDKPKDTDLVYAEINKLLIKDINAVIRVNFLSWGEWQQRYPLLFASGDEFDLIYTANWTQYNTQAMKGAYKEITKDLLKKYAPKTVASMYPEAWEQAKIAGKVYMVPMNFREIQGSTVILRGDIMDKYNIPAPKKITDLAPYFAASLKEKLVPWSLGSDMNWSAYPVTFIWNSKWGYFDSVGIKCAYCYDATNKKTVRVIDMYDTPEYLASAKLAKQWASKGFWSESALVNKIPSQDAFIRGTSGFDSENLATANGIYISVMTIHPEWKVRVFDGYFGRTPEVKPYIQNGMAISRTCRNVGKALQALDLFKNDQRYFDLLFYGIKGRHYELAPDGKSIKPLSDSYRYPPESAGPWGFRDDRFVRSIVGGIDNGRELRASWSKRAFIHPMHFFNFDDSKVKREVAAVANIQTQYGKPIDFGVVDDVDSAIVQFKQMLKIAGRQIVTAELQRQINEYMKTDGK